MNKTIYCRNDIYEDEKLSAKALFVYHALATLYKEKRQASYINIEKELPAGSGLSRMTIKRLIEELAKEGYVDIEVVRGGFVTKSI